MANIIYRYFKIQEYDIPQIIEACNKTLEKYNTVSDELLTKYGIHKFMIYRNATRSERARKRGIVDPAEHMDVLVLFKKTDVDRVAEAEIESDNSNREFLKTKLKKTQRKARPGFTSVNSSSALLGDDYMLYKIDLRKREGKDIFNEFIELYKLNPDELKPYQFIANCFNIQNTLVPNKSIKASSKYSYYETFGERLGDGFNAFWIFAVPIYSKRFASIAGHGDDEPRGLPENFVVSAPMEEIERAEYLQLRNNL